MGSGLAKSFRRVEAIFDRSNNTNSTFARGSIAFICGSLVLVQEKLDGQIKKQAPVYFVSEVISLSKKNYPELEKVLYVVLMASRKLRHYFQAYHIIVPSSQPLKDIMRNREVTRRIGK
jgi:ribonuclease HI